jgi:hypothetical protein
MSLTYGVTTAKRVADLCRRDLRSGSRTSLSPNLLLRFAQQGTAEQQVAFFNLLVTLLKLSATAPYSSTDSGSQCRNMVSEGAGMLLLWAALDTGSIKTPPSNTAAAAADAGVSGAASGSRSSSSSSSVQAGSSSDTSPALWLLLLGRCCLQWAAELAQLQAEGADWVQIIKQTKQHADAVSYPAATATPPVSTLCFCFSGRQVEVMAETASSAVVIKRDREGSSISAALTAAGYDMRAVLQGFEALAACYPAVLEVNEAGDVVAGNVAGLIKAFEAVGRACSVFAVPHCCNNPGCSNLAGASELFIVSGKGCICGGCQVARYCGRECQKAHWKQHKPVCRMLQAAGAQHS